MSNAFELVKSLRDKQAFAFTTKIGARQADNRSAPSRRKRALSAFLAAVFVLSACFFVAGTNIPGVIAEEDNSAASFFRADRARLRAKRAVSSVPSLTIFGSRGADQGKVPGIADPLKRASKKKSNGTKLAALADGAPRGSGASLGSRSVCVRLCDGFHFPVGDYSGSGDVNAHEAICSGLCPGAPTRLYVMRAGTEDIGEAVSARGGKSYAALPVALRHTVKHDKTCSCRAPEEPYMAMVSLRKDFTLRRGDAVMTEKGVKIFNGAKKWPYVARNFSSIGRNKTLSRSERRNLYSLERASSARSQAQQANARLLQTSRINGYEMALPAFGPFPPERPSRFAGFGNAQ